jgi:hypothetical protein
MRIPILAEQPRLHFADWRIAIVKVTSELGTLYHPEHGWMVVGMLTAEEQLGLEHAGVSSTSGLRFTQELTTITNLYGKFYTPLTTFYASLRPITNHPLQKTTQISDHID